MRWLTEHEPSMALFVPTPTVFYHSIASWCTGRVAWPGGGIESPFAAGFLEGQGGWKHVDILHEAIPRQVVARRQP